MKIVFSHKKARIFCIPSPIACLFTWNKLIIQMLICLFLVMFNLFLVVLVLFNFSYLHVCTSVLCCPYLHVCTSVLCCPYLHVCTSVLCCPYLHVCTSCCVVHIFTFVLLCCVVHYDFRVIVMFGSYTHICFGGDSCFIYTIFFFTYSGLQHDFHIRWYSSLLTLTTAFYWTRNCLLF